MTSIPIIDNISLDPNIEVTTSIDGNSETKETSKSNS